MKYLRLKIQYNIIPQCIENFNKALIRIGEINPLNIRLKRSKHNTNSSSKSQLLKIGIMNVRKKLNIRLGQNGKYSMRMIKTLANIKAKYYANEELYICANIPDREYIAILSAAFILLNELDNNYCDELLNCEYDSNYIGKNTYKGKKYKIIAPVQTGMIRVSQGNGFYNDKRLFYLNKNII